MRWDTISASVDDRTEEEMRPAPDAMGEEFEVEDLTEEWKGEGGEQGESARDEAFSEGKMAKRHPKSRCVLC